MCIRDSKNPIHYRDTIELGYRLQGNGTAAADLLAHWTGNDVNNGGESWQQQMNAWSQWYSTEFPTAAPVANLDAANAGVDRVADGEAILSTSSDFGGRFVR